MGPPPFGDGKGRWPPSPTSSASRFNGATAFRRWKARTRAQRGHRHHLHRASMGPPPFGDGKGRWPPSPTSSASRFNGATAFRRWKARTRAQRGHRHHLHRASMGPPPFGDGKGRWPPSPTSSASRFNGATAFRRWKARTRAQRGHRHHLHRASMGPPPFGDGKGRWPPSPTSSASRFNGATAFRRWKARTRAQRGHRHHLHRASMGPPPFGDGKGDGPLRQRPLHRASMGHRLSAMESSNASATRPPPSSASRFNGATPSAMERGDGPLRQRPLHRASMGPPPFGDGKLERERNEATAIICIALQWGHRLSAMERGDGPLRQRPLHRASMGPPPFGDGKLERERNEATAIICIALQWGHRLSANGKPQLYSQREQIMPGFNGPPPSAMESS